MINEFLSFVVLRAPEPSDLNNEKTRPVRVKVETEVTDSLNLTDEDKEKVYKKASQHLEISKDYSLENLPLPLASFMTWYERQQAPISDELFISSIARILGVELTSLTTSRQFLETKRTVTRTLILSSIADKNVDFLRPEFLRALKFLSALETLATLQSQRPANDFAVLLQRTVLLPNQIFPVNFESAAYKIKKEALLKKQATMREEQEDAVKKITRKLLQYKNASTEILKSFDNRDNRSSANVSANDRTEIARVSSVGVTKTSLFNNLNKNAVENLTSETKAILKKENFNQDTVNVAMAVNKLENAQRKLHIELSGAKVPFMAIGTIVQFIPLASAVPGRCPVANESPVPVPFEDFPPKKGNGFFHAKYSGDLQKVRQTLKRYELGEIASIENVMIGEKKLSQYKQFQKTEEAITTATETEEESKKEMQTNDQYQLQTESSKTVSQDKSKEAGITVTGSFSV